MKKLLRQLWIGLVAVYVLYTAVVLGAKYYYDHPRILPAVNEGKIDDWQYEASSYHYRYQTPWEELTDLSNVSQYWEDYLLKGFGYWLLVGIWLTLTVIPAVKFSRHLKKYLASKDALTKLQERAHLAILLPALVFQWVVFLFGICWLANYFNFYASWFSLLVKLSLLCAFALWCAAAGYLLISGLVNFGSRNAKIKRVGKKKLAWSCLYTPVVFLITGGLLWVLFATLWGPRYDDLDIQTFGGAETSIGGAVLKTASVANPVNGLAVQDIATESFVANDTIGLAVGGAKDVNNFRENIKNDYLPEPTDISYEGLFYDYFFETGQKQPCNKLFCPSYTSAISPDPYTGEDQYYLSVGLNSGLKESDFTRKKLNLMVVLDISGSMGSRFDQYYYDGDSQDADELKTKMEIANQSIVHLMEHLGDDDRLGVVLFDDQAYLAKPFRLVGETDMNAIAKHVLDIQDRGGTNMAAGIELGAHEFAKVDTKDSEYDNRIIFLTDAMPNTGDTSKNGLFGRIRELALDNISTTFVGIGVDLNSELISELTKVRGANYYSVHSALDFKRRLADEFDYMVTPLVFDLDLVVEAPGYEIAKVYGSPEADQATGKIMSVNTLFPSSSSGGENRGGLVLLQLKKRPGATNNQITIRTTYQDRDGHRDGDSQTFTFAGEPDVYTNTGIHKGILLTRYASVLQDWLLHSRYDDLNYAADRVKFPELAAVGPEHYPGHGIIPITWPVRDGQWERGSQLLTVSSDYVPVFQTLRDYFSQHQRQIGDDTLLQELDILDVLIRKGEKGTPAPAVTDDTTNFVPDINLMTAQ